MTFRFLHSGDLHLGKRFGQFSGDLPARLREARHTALGRLAEQARNHGASTILLAGDTFDTETPAPDVRRQALQEMRHHAPIRWVLLPGNHDSLQSSLLWSTLVSEAPDNVLLATGPQPVELAPGIVLLPAPCTTRRPGRDLTAWMDDAPTPEGALRIGLAHGAVQSFSEEGNGLDVIAPDRARRAGLAYLALGDWHGALEIDPRTRYSGTPEPDRFKHDRPGAALVVSLEAPAAIPIVEAVPTGMFAWNSVALDLLETEDGMAKLRDVLPDQRMRRHTLLSLVASGRTRLETRTSLLAEIEVVRPEFAFLALDDEGLETACEPEDLDAIDRAGALREAAEMLLAEVEDPALPADARAIARAALGRLHAYAQRVAP